MFGPFIVVGTCHSTFISIIVGGPLCTMALVHNMTVPWRHRSRLFVAGTCSLLRINFPQPPPKWTCAGKGPFQKREPSSSIFQLSFFSGGCVPVFGFLQHLVLTSNMTLDTFSIKKCTKSHESEQSLFAVDSFLIRLDKSRCHKCLKLKL